MAAEYSPRFRSRVLLAGLIAWTAAVAGARAEQPFKLPWGAKCDRLPESYGEAKGIDIPYIADNEPVFPIKFMGFPAEVRFQCVDGGMFTSGLLASAQIAIPELDSVPSKEQAKEQFCPAMVVRLKKLYGEPWVYSASWRWETFESYIVLRCAHKGDLMSLNYDSKRFFTEKGMRRSKKK